MVQRTRHISYLWSAALLAAASCHMMTNLVQAASIPYGDFGPLAPGVAFLNVTESTGTGDPLPLYGAPTPFVTGLDFNPTVDFRATASGGAGDITDGQLNFSIVGQDGSGNHIAVSSVMLSEGGVYDLTGVGTAATQVNAGAIVNVTVKEIDGATVPPFTLSGGASFSRNVTDVAGDEVNVNWSLNIIIDVQAELTTLGIPFTVGATRVDVDLNNTLTAISASLTTAGIVKNDFAISIVPQQEVIPEPSALALAGLGLGGLALRRSRKAS